VGLDSNPGTLDNYPVLVNLSGPWLRTTAADPTNGRIEHFLGWDIIFRDSDEVTQLDHEIEYYDGSASGGDVALSDSWSQGAGAYTAPTTGSNRLLVFVTCTEQDPDADVTDVDFGSAQMIQGPEHSYNGNAAYSRCEIWYLKDADIPAGSNSFSVTYSTAPFDSQHARVTFVNVNQMMPFVDNSGNEYAQDTDGILSVSNFNMEEGGMTIAAAVNGVQAGSWDWSGGSGWSEGLDFDGTSIRMAVAHSDSTYSTSGTDSVTATYTPGTLNDQVLVVASLRPASAGNLVAWVRIPSLAKDSDTQFYMYYGNSCTNSNPQNSAGVWVDYAGVWHLMENGNGSAGEFKDSTQYGNHGQGGEGSAPFVPTRTTGRIAYGQDFVITPDSNTNGADEGQLIDCGNDTSLDITGNEITLEAWVKHSIVPAFGGWYGILNHKGWDYGYVGPAFSKCLQSAGRCIRSEEDRGIVVFLDERYTWQNYFKHFPRDMQIEVSKDYMMRVTEFFSAINLKDLE